MSRCAPIRRVPSLRVLVLLGALLAAPGPGPVAGAGPALAYSPPDCATLSPLAPGPSVVWAAPSAGVTQPFAASARLAACSLSVANLPYYTAAKLTIFHLDPSGLAPDPTTVALRTRSFTPSSLAYGRTRADFSPPIVTEALPHVAEASARPIAMDWKVTDPYNGQNVRYDGAASASLPPALYYPPGGSRAPLPGASPALNLYVCDGGAAISDLRVAQAVMRTDELQPARQSWAQRFRVPETVQVGWVELALGQSNWPIHTVLGRVALYEADGQAVPPASWSTPLNEATLVTYGLEVPVWSPPFDFDRPTQLLPGRDYWLVFDSQLYYRPFARLVGGAESADFTDGIGDLFSRDSGSGPWNPAAGRALGFRLIGAPAATVGVEGPAAARSPFRLHAAPNPAAGPVELSWSGARGPVRLEVLDARGRRVARAGPAGERWRWAGRDERGAPLPAGVYFVRARDGAGRAATLRLVRVR